MAPITTNERDGDWLASLARQSTSADNSNRPNNTSKRKRKRGGGGGGADNATGRGDNGATADLPLTKAERIERRERKRAQREERRRSAEEARRNRLARKRQRQGTRGPGVDAAARTPSSRDPKSRAGRSSRRGNNMTPASERALARLSTDLGSTVSRHVRSASAPAKRHRKNSRPPEDVPTINGVPATEPKGKATRRATLRHDSKELQPRKRDYNGQGLVRPTLYLPLDDPSFVPKLELEFAEHVPGFFGRAKTKAAKKQSDGNMLWKRCLRAKEAGKAGESDDGGGGGGGRKKKKKRGGSKAKLAERVDDLMKEGIM